MAESGRLPSSIDKTLGIEKIEQTTYNIVCRIDAKVTVTGKSGAVYVFNGGGSVVEVAAADVPEILKYRLGEALCCGDATTNIMFEMLQA